MAIAYNSSLSATGGNSSTPTLGTLTIPSITDGYIVCALELENTNQTVSSFVLDDGAGGGAQTFTQIVAPVDVEAGNFRMLFFGLTNPTAGSGRRILVTLSASGPWRIGADVYSGVDQTTPTVDPQSGTDASSPGSQLNTSARNGSWMIGHANCPYGSLVLSSGGVNRTQVSTAAGVGYIEDSNTTVASGNTNTFSWTFSTKMGWQTAMMQPPAAAGPANLKTYNTNPKANIKTVDTNTLANMKSLDTNT